MFNKKEAIYLYIVNCLFYLIPISILLILPSLALKKIRTCILTGFSHFIHHETNKKQISPIALFVLRYCSGSDQAKKRGCPISRIRQPLSQKSLRKKIYLIITSFSRFLRIPVPYSSCNIPGKDLVTTNLSDQVSVLLLFHNQVQPFHRKLSVQLDLLCISDH